MDPRLQTILRLYGEQDAASTTAGDDAARTDEHQPLSEAKFWLDHRPRVRPNAAVLDEIFRALGPGTQPAMPGLRHDRPPVRARRLRRAAWLVGVTFALVVGVAVAPLAPPAATPPPPTEVAGASQREGSSVLTPAPAPEAVTEVPPVPVTPAVTPVVTTVSTAWTDKAEEAKADEIEERALALRARLDSLAWDAPATSLKLPAPTREGRFTQAASGGY